MNDKYGMGRRRFLEIGMRGLVSLPLVFAATRATLAIGADAPLVDESDPSAVALDYVHDATKVDVAKFLKRTGDAGGKQFCHNCSRYQAEGETGQGPCSIFPGKSVKAAGWCNAWVPKG